MAIKPNARIILASSSPRRKEILASLQLTFDVMAPPADERYDPSAPPSDIVEQIAERKAQSIADVVKRENAINEDVIVIGADTVVVSEGNILGKPAETDEAVRMLNELSGRVHDVYSGLALIVLRKNGENDKFVGYRRTAVHFKTLDQPLIERYVATGEPLDKAGAYAIQGFGSTFVEKLDGDYFTVVGFPVPLFSDYLASAGFQLF